MKRIGGLRTHRMLWAGLAVAVATWSQPAHAAEKLRIVTTTTDLKSLAEAVGGQEVTVASIATGHEDPHFVQAKPSFMMLARKADLWIRVGMELEIGYEGLILDGCRNPRIRVGTRGHLDAAADVLRLEVPKVRITREMGDVHPEGNPHCWLDPLNGRIVAGEIAARLAELMPAKAEAFGKNLSAFQRKLDERMFGRDLVAGIGGEKLWALELKGTLAAYLDQTGQAGKLGGWAGKMQPLRGRKIVTYHRSWSYLANRFGLTVAAELEPKPGVPPSPAHLAEVIDLIRAEHIQVILLEPFYERKAADLVAGKTGAKVVVCANCVSGQKEASDYVSLIDLIVEQLGGALGGPGPAVAGQAGSGS